MSWGKNEMITSSGNFNIFDSTHIVVLVSMALPQSWWFPDFIGVGVGFGVEVDNTLNSSPEVSGLILDLTQGREKLLNAYQCLAVYSAIS